MDEDEIQKAGLAKFITEFFTLWFGWPLYALCVIMHGLPLYIAKQFADKNIKKTEFYASIRLNLGMLLWVPNVIIQLVVVALLFHSWWAVAAYLLMIPLLAMYGLKFYSVRKKISGRWRLLRLVKTNRNVVLDLVNERSAIIAELNGLHEKFS